MVYTPFIWPFLIATVLLAGIAFYAGRYSYVPAVRPFMWMMWLCAAWAFVYALNMATADFGLKFIWVQLQMFLSMFVVPAMFVLALEYIGLGHWVTRRNLALLLVVPILSVFVELSSPYHELFRYNFRLDLSNAFPIMLTDKGPIFRIYEFYAVGLAIISCGVLVAAFRVQTLRIQNTFLILLGFAIPLASNLLYMFGLIPVKGFDPTPAMFTITSILFLWAHLPRRLLDVVPIARNTVMDNIHDLVIVLDTHGHIVDFNRAAQISCGLSPATIGTAPGKLPAAWAEIFRRYADTSSCKDEVTINNHVFELTISSIQDKPTHILGRLFIFHDITKRKQVEADEREQRILAEALRDTAEALNSTLDFDSVLDKILDNVGHVVPIDSANIALLEGGNLNYVRFHGYKDHKLSENDMKVVGFSLASSPIFKKVFKTGEPIIIPDTYADPDWIVTPIGAWIRSYAVMPIRIKERVVGVLNLDSAVLRLYTPEHIHRLCAFADQVAIAIENARLYAAAEHEIMERKQAEGKLRQLSLAVEQSPASIVITDTTGKIEYVNPRFTHVTGYSAEDVIGKNPRILKTGKTPPQIYTDLWDTITAGKEWRGEFVNRKKDGEFYNESALISPIIDPNGVITHFLAVKEDITERKKAEEEILLLQAELREQAIRDPLTGLYNRRYLNEFMEHELARAAREHYSVSFVMIDIDHFKKINDTFGHSAGDSVLQRLATQLLGQARVADIICRYGGEEFLAILPNVTSEIAFQITERWRRSFMGSTLPLDYNIVKATISCGISEYTLHGNTSTELIAQADKAMYQAKAKGRNRSVIAQTNE